MVAEAGRPAGGGPRRPIWVRCWAAAQVLAAMPSLLREGRIGVQGDWAATNCGLLLPPLLVSGDSRLLTIVLELSTVDGLLATWGKGGGRQGKR